jgi:ethanolamine utilization cobalamin adenosyltransferase
MVITESELRELWRNGTGALPAFPPGTRFSPSAQDFINAHRLEVRVEPSLQPPAAQPRPAPWDRPAAFPVALAGPLPVCIECGQPVPHKPGHMTQLDAHHFAPKTHPRLRVRGQLDSLHAGVMLAAAEARRYQLPGLAGALDTLAAYCREIQSAEYNGRAVQPLVMLGKSENEIHSISHWPDRHLGLAHLAPGSGDHAILHWLNFVRTMARDSEITASEVYGPKAHTHDSEPAGVVDFGIPHALNRLSSAVYYLELLFKRGDLGWKVGT